MTAEDVSDFLTKVIKESDFNNLDPWECVCRFCYSKKLPYAKAVSLMNGEAAADHPEEKALTEKISDLKKQAGNLSQNQREKAFQVVYGECRKLVADLYQEENDTGDGSRIWRPEDIGPSDIEKMLCDGIPVTSGGNRMRMSTKSL